MIITIIKKIVVRTCYVTSMKRLSVCLSVPGRSNKEREREARDLPIHACMSCRLIFIIAGAFLGGNSDSGHVVTVLYSTQIYP